MQHSEASALARWRAQRYFFVVLLAVAALFGTAAFGQQLTATLSGTAYDQAGAVVPNAKIELANESSGNIRRTVTGSTGNFTLTAVPPGTYTVKVDVPGFAPWEAKGIVLNQGDSRSLANIVLRVATTTEQVEVSAISDSVAVKDTAETGATLNQQMVNEIALTGRDAGELLKIMPGMALATGLNQANFSSDKAVGSNSGPVGQYSANGTQPNGAMAFMLDGANLVDSNMGTQIANINQDMVAEVKVLMGAYGAEYAKGPVVFQAFSKSGGKGFHGSGYFYGRNSALNAQDSYQKNQGVKAPDTYYYYPGGNIGGPVLLPFTKFNRNRDKLFFWFGYEYMVQHPAGSLNQYFVPTPEMKAGNFSPSYLASLPSAGGWGPAFNVPCGNTGASNYAVACTNTGIVGGMIPPSMFDATGVAYLKLMPAANLDPATHNGLNYQFINKSPQNRWEQSEKVDYAVNDNTKLSVSYTRQMEHRSNPIATWWAPNQAIPYPSTMPADTPSNVLSANFTHVFTPTLVNEAVVTYATYTNGLVLAKPDAVDPSKLGMTYKGLFGVEEKQMADLLSWSGGLADFMPQATYYGAFNGGQFGAKKGSYAAYDNLSKVVGTHTLKFGFYWDRNANLQSTTGLQGQWEYETYGATSTQNTIADALIGHAQSYSQQNTVPVGNTMFNQYSIYAQDSWKASRRLTINIGIRGDHIGQYYDPNGKGAIIFDPASYVFGPNPPANNGLTWCKINPKIPCSGWKSPLFYYDPRASVAYDLFGNAKTVLRGGVAVFRYQVGTGPAANAYATSNGSFNYNTSNVGTQVLSTSQINSITGLPTTGNVNGGTINVMQLNDTRVPSTVVYNFTISQAAPWRSVFEVSYVGNHSWNTIVVGGNSKQNDPNAVPVGAFFKPDPTNGTTYCTPGRCNPGLTPSHYFAYPTYQDIYIAGHGSYANYNSVQAAWTKSTGPVLLMMNYAFGKVLGVRDGVSMNGGANGTQVDSFIPRNNYGVLTYDHTHVFNATYVVHLPSPIRDSHLLKGLINGWELSGVTQLQSGAPIQPNSNATLNVSWPGSVSNSAYLGTNANTLVPKLTCDPRSGLSSGQYFNPSCFAPPAPGTNGDLIWPYIKGPKYFNSDLSLYKNFKFAESRSLQLRLQAFNFLNHANGMFGLQGQNDFTLRFQDSAGQLTQTNQNTTTTGKPSYTMGNRFVEVAVKFYF